MHGNMLKLFSSDTNIDLFSTAKYMICNYLPFFEKKIQVKALKIFELRIQS